jgi:hypothetical protein
MKTSHWMAAAAILLCSQMAAEAQLLTVDVVGDLVNRGGHTIGSFDGVLDVEEFVVENGELIANGVLNGDVLNRAGRVITTIEDLAVSLPVTDLSGEESPDGVCQILSLSLGPLDLDVLGLIVHLDEVNLDISADPAGGLLGELLCGLADLLSDVLNLDIGLDDLLDALDLGSLLDLLDLAGLLDDVLDILNGIGAPAV